MNSRGMTLIELLVGLAVASMVAAIALTALSIAGNAVARKLVAVRTEDSAWLALAAIARDLRVAKAWSGCIQRPTCTERSAHRATSVLILDHAMWFAEKGLKRCPTDKSCDGYLHEVTQSEFFAYVPKPDGRVERESLTKENGAKARAIEVVLSMNDGRRYARTTARPAHAR